MLYNLEEFTRNYVKFTAVELFTLASLFKPMSLKENDVVIKKSESLSTVYFLDRGVVKIHDHHKTADKVKLYSTPMFFSDLKAIIHCTRSTRNVVTVKETNVFMANFEDIIKLNSRSENHQKFFNMIFKEDYMFNSHDI